MAEMLGRLKLTLEESDAVEVADDIEEDLATSDCVIIGKVLSQGVLHIQTITSALKPAWGNPKGLRMRTAGDNMFIADFGSKQDKNRVLDGSPWNIGKRAVLVQEFDASMRPSDIHFDHVDLGPVEKLEVDDQDRACGAYLRAKVQINITKPLMRGVSIFSTKRQVKEWYEVRYEKLPNYCYSCGIIGHSSVECLIPAERDADGLLPYSGDLRVPDDKKKRPSDDVNGQNSISAGKSGGTSGQESMSGDFNEALSSDEHLGRTERGGSQMKLFRECLENCGLLDLGFSGPKFTWNNRQEGINNVRVRLDRAVVNGQFLQLFDDCHVDNIITFSSDHYAILISIGRGGDTKDYRHVTQNFRYEAMWARAADYKEVVEKN
ncbi:unnamed protein product [Miscanthus lutarioriparius]|uniref:CCHC-type domain-containing protein n=1 Tax=Miscanthus lutarioriparius TaxID=422564 RepID=A0A811PUX6_9POAL|nr:unnamed protein product [Miscanthus lutarioriparius]